MENSKLTVAFQLAFLNKKSLFLNHNITILSSYYTMEKTKFASPYHYLKAADIFNLSLFIEKKRKHKINP